MKALLITVLTSTAAALFLRSDACPSAPASGAGSGQSPKMRDPMAPRLVRTVQLKQRRILFNGHPQQIFAGEIHYFRLKPEDWADRLDKLQAAGFNTVATYIPWIWHELPAGTVDLTGATHPQRDLVKFLDLCHQRGLDVIARPGPFVMAELKNEGIPYRLYREPTNLRPTSWGGKPVQTATLDYLSPSFLNEVRGWYAQVMPVLASRLATKGGAVIAVQLDNEIGMLSWAANTPDLTDLVCEDMRGWARRKYGDDVAAARIGAEARDASAWAAALRSPKGDALALHQDLGLYNRDRFRRYVRQLKWMSESFGVKGIPFLVNVHGTSGGRGRTFPIGISQLMETWKGDKDIMPGTDTYIGDLSVGSLPDLYTLNAFMRAATDDGHPVGSFEFEAGDANYGDDLGLLNSPESAELRARLCVAQGDRLLNFYLFCGGENPPLEQGDDGLNFIAITGQRHGYAAPVGPEGQLNPTYGAMKRVVARLSELGPMLGDSLEEGDGLALGFVPDQYLTEYAAPGAQKRREQIADLERFRGMGPRESLVRNLLLGGFSFPAVNLQDGVPTEKCIVLSTGRYLGRDVQKNLAKYVHGGGKLLLNGLLPDLDMDGSPCTVLADAIGLSDAGRLFEGPNAKDGAIHWTSVHATGWASGRADARVSVVQTVATQECNPLVAATAQASALLPPLQKPLVSSENAHQSPGGAPGIVQISTPARSSGNVDVFMVDAETKRPCGVVLTAGKGKVVFFGTDYGTDFALFKSMLEKLGVTPRFGLTFDYPGVMVTSTVSSKFERLLHVINVAPYAVQAELTYYGKPLFEGKSLALPARSGLILPLRMNVSGCGELSDCTAELVSQEHGSFLLRPTQKVDSFLLTTKREVALHDWRLGTVTHDGTSARVTIWSERTGGKPVRITVK